MRAKVFRGLLAAAAVAIAAAGCGLGPGAGTYDVSLSVTSDFGTHRLGGVSQSQVPGSETVMRMLERHFRISTRYGGGFVESIDGHSGTSSQRDWFFYVNGIQASAGAAATAVHHGDRIWWDLHYWSAAESIPAVVGSFPEPFLHGTGGRRLPTTLECAPDAGAMCQQIGAQLARLGVPAADQLLGSASGTDSLDILIGPWRDLAPTIAGRLIDKGPRASGVYARFAGDSLQLLGPSGQVVRTLGPGTGLIAATGGSSTEPTWLVTGTDPAGLAAAVRALTPARLDDRFALAVRAGQGPARDIPLPVGGP